MTGATGFIGSNFVNKALSSNHRVTALCPNNSFPRVPLIKEPFWCRGNLSDNWNSYLKDCDFFVHFASEGVTKNNEDWKKCLDINFVQTECLIRKAFSCGINKFLICGSCSEYGISGNEYIKIPVDAQLKPVDAYGYSKALAGLAALNFAKNNNLKLVLARLFHVYGKGENPNRFWPSLVKAANNGDDFDMTLGNQLRNFTPVEEVVSKLFNFCINMDSLNSGGIIKNVGSSNNLSLKDFAFAEWQRLKAKGEIKLGILPYRNKEIMSYIPELD